VLPDANTIPATADALDVYVERLTSMIQRTIQAHAPQSQPYPYTKRWWTPELTQLRKEFARASRLEFQARDSLEWEALRTKWNKIRNTYTAVLCKTKYDHWKDWLESIDEQDIWKAGKLAKNPLSDRGRTLIPMLHKKNAQGDVLMSYDTAEMKAAALTGIFFLLRPMNLPSMPSDDEPNPRPLPFTTPALHQVIKRIEKSKPHKAPGNDGIPNIVLKEASGVLAPCLHTCLQAVLQLSYFPRAWREWTTVVLRKPGKPDYTIPKAYRPIALYNTMGKIVSGVITDVTMYLTVRHSLLPARHFGGLPGCTTLDSLLFLTHKIKDAWRSSKVVTIIFLDIANAFPNAVTERLLHNMELLRYPTEIVNFFCALLSEHFTRLCFDDFLSELITIDNGIGQGESASMLLYLIYNNSLVSIPQGRNQNGGAYVDDTFFMAIADTFDKCDEILNAMLDKQETRSKAHNSPAEVSKFQCLRLTRKNNLERSDFVCAGGQLITCICHAKLLGVLLDESLRWHAQVSSAVKKGTDLLLAINRLTRPSFGLPARYVSRLFISMVLPKVEYALPVWYSPPDSSTQQHTGKTRGSVGHMRQLAKVQRLGCKLITGAFRCTATDILDLHANIPPIQIRLEDTCYRETLRLASLPESHPLFKIVKSSAQHQSRRHTSPIHYLFRLFQVKPGDIEVIDPTRKHPAWQPEFTAHIAKDKDTAMEIICMQMDTLKFFTDGSGTEGNIGAAAILLDPPMAFQYHLGTDSDHTVFEGELTGVLLALHMVDRLLKPDSILIALDNQAAIRALQKSSPQPGQHILDAIHARIRQLRSRRKICNLHLEWVPGHKGVEGNEAADVSAKEAANGTSSPPAQLPPLLLAPLPSSTAALKAECKISIQSRRLELWKVSPRYSKMSKTGPSLPSAKFTKQLLRLDRKSTSILVQLCSGHVGLNGFLKKRKAVPSALCKKCNQPETVAHYLIHCRRYHQERMALKKEVGKAANSVSRLLSDPKIIHATLRYISATKRFKDYMNLKTDTDG